MEDHEYESLSALLRTVDPPPTSVSVDAILDAGRRGARRRRVMATAAAASGIAIVLFGAVGAVALTRQGTQAPPSTASHKVSTTPTAIPSVTDPNAANCTIQQLPSPPGAMGDMMAADPTGRFQAGQTDLSDGNQGKPVLWTDGVPTLLTVPKAIMDTTYSINAVSSNGDLALSTASSAYRYHDGKFTKLSRLAGFSNNAPSGIAPNGDIVGWVDSDGSAFAAVVWPADQPGSVRKLATPHGRSAEAMAIDADGAIGGSLGDGGAPFVWSANGQGHELAVPSGYQGGMVFSLSGDWAVGWVGVKGSTQVVGARWNLATGNVNVYADQDEALAVNAHGDFVGGLGDSTGYLFRDDTFKDLPGPAYGSEVTPRSISADGKTIAGTAYSASSNAGSPNVIWHC